jgi:hypothetical protein
MGTEAWAQDATANHGLGVASTSSIQSFGYKLGYSDGTYSDRDMNIIELPAKQQDPDNKMTDLKRKKLVEKALGIESKSRSYKDRAGIFKRQWIAFLKSTTK